ncbi:MAG: purine-nucleoside phosphorylase [Verrucomicrobiota bacterium]
MNFNPKTTAAFLRRQTTLRPPLALVLGSGFQHAVTHLDVKIEIPYGQLPGFTSVGVSGHAGKLVIGHCGKIPVLVLKGRSHFYEGHDMERITFPIRVLNEFGVRSLLLTNAAGGINRKFKAGDFMILEDHINLMGTNPLRGPALPGLPRFVDMTHVYDAKLNGLLRKAGKQARLRIHSGVYLATQGPCYETPAEIRAFARLGADAVGMSTVPEAIVARQCGLSVAAISCITNLAAGQGKGALSHQEVLASGEQKKVVVAEFLKKFCELYAGN